MRKTLCALAMTLLTTTAFAADQPQKPTPPTAAKQPVKSTLHGEERVDDYAWLRQKSPETISYLEAENAYADALMKDADPLRKALYDEMLGRIKQTDMNVPYRKNGFYYYTRTQEGKQYPVYARKKGTLEAEEQVMLDVNELAIGRKFMSVGAFDVSDDSNLLAYTTDDNGYRQYKLFIKDLTTGKTYGPVAEKVGSTEWSADGKSIFYSVENEAKRQYRVYRHEIATDKHTLLFEEKDPLYDVFVNRSRDGAFIFIVSESKTTNEIQLVPAATPQVAPVTMMRRQADRKYYPEHRNGRFYFVINDTGLNYRVVSAPVLNYAKKDEWVEVVPHRKPVRVEATDMFKDFMVVRLREGGLSHFEIYPFEGDAVGKPHRMSFAEEAYAVFPGPNAEFDTKSYRYNYQSFITPATVYDYDLSTRKQTLLKRTEVLGGFDPAKYRVERFFVTASDGAKIPVALVHRKDIDAKAKNPLLLYAYGSYGASMPYSFSSNRFSLIDRGVTYAIASIRGGGEMGKEWHDQGRMMTKKNTFTDFVAVAEQLVKAGYTTSDKLAIQGGSAGGLLMGAVVNMRPDLFRAVMAYVPFVDVINTMLDDTLPLTTQEYIEWGNPNEKDAYLYMKSYDPYSNIEKKAYPRMLVRTALNDSQVGFWEAAKWVAKLRATKTDENPIVLKVNMGAGHGGASGRYDKLSEDAWDYAWLLTQLGLVSPPAETKAAAVAK